MLARLGLGVFDRPARVAILLAELRGLVFLVVGDAAALDRLLRVLGVAPTRSGDQARIDDLARHGDGTGLPKRCIEAREQWPDGAGLGEFLSEQPNRPGVGTRSDNPNPRKLMNDSRSLTLIVDKVARTWNLLSIGEVGMQQHCLGNGKNSDKSSIADGQVVALIPTYNRKELVCECLAACLAQSEPPDHIFLLDNGSTDGTKEILQAAGFLKDPRINYFSFRRNVGPAGALDQLIRLAWMSNCDWMWIMDDDVIPAKSALQELKAAFRENFVAPEKIGLMASVNVSGDDLPNNVPEIEMRRPTGQDPIWGELLSRGLVRIRWSTFGSILIPRSTIAKFGSVNPVFWGSGLDIDFTLRITREAPIYLVGKSVAKHLRNVSGTFSVLTETDPTRIRYFFYHYRNNVYIRLKYYSFIRAIVFAAKALIEAIRALAEKEYPSLRARNILWGTVSGFFFRPTFKPIGPPCFPMEQDMTWRAAARQPAMLDEELDPRRIQPKFHAAEHKHP